MRDYKVVLGTIDECGIDETGPLRKCVNTPEYILVWYDGYSWCKAFTCSKHTPFGKKNLENNGFYPEIIMLDVKVVFT